MTLTTELTEIILVNLLKNVKLKGDVFDLRNTDVILKSFESCSSTTTSGSLGTEMMQMKKMIIVPWLLVMAKGKVKGLELEVKGLEAKVKGKVVAVEAGGATTGAKWSYHIFKLLGNLGSGPHSGMSFVLLFAQNWVQCIWTCYFGHSY